MTEVEELRNKMGLSRKALAPLLGVSWRTIEGWEQERFKPNNATLKFLRHLAAVTPKSVPKIGDSVPKSKNEKPSK